VSEALQSKDLMETRPDKSMRYLLGRLTEQGMAEFEAQCFEDDDLFHELTEMENDLLHSYVRGELSAAERKEFETGYLISPARRQKVEFVRALERHLYGTVEEDQGRPQQQAQPALFFQSWKVRMISGAAALMALAIISLLTVMNYRLKAELRQMEAQQAEMRHAQQELETRLTTLTARPQESGSTSGSQLENPLLPNHPVIAFNLTPELPRSADTVQHLAIPPEADRVEMNLYLEDDKYASYRALLETTGGKRIWRNIAIKSHADSDGRRIISCGLISHVLKRGDYMVRLDGVTATGEVEKDVAAYRFVVNGR